MYTQMELEGLKFKDDLLLHVLFHNRLGFHAFSAMAPFARNGGYNALITLISMTSLVK